MRAQADQQHARFKADASDFLTWLNLWRYVKEQQRELSSSAFRRMCKREFLNYLRVREWQDFESQLRQVCKEMKIQVGQPADTPDADGIHQALLSGLLSHIGLLEEREKEHGRGGGGRRPMREYLGARGAKFAIFPGSGLARQQPAFVMAGELVETSRLFARQNAAIKPEWAERLGEHLVKRTYSEPHWSKKRASVMAHERVTLYGVPLVADRLVSFGKVDRAYSREIFIRHALVYGEWSTRQKFFTHNRDLLDEAAELEHRARRRGIVVDEHTLFDFYDARVGAEVVSGAHFDTWWKRERQQRPDLLMFDLDMLTHDNAEQVRETDFPTAWSGTREGLTFPISYHFEPGSADDGLTIDVPVATLNQVADDDFSWNVPGLREELVTSLIRSLPKNLRVAFVPAPDRAREFLATTPAGEEPLLDALERWCRSTTGVVVPREAWDWSKIAQHLRPTYRVVDDAGAEQARGKDLEALKAPLRPQFAEALAEVAGDSGLARTGETTWVFGTIEPTITQRRAGHEVTAHPALVDEGDTVGLAVHGSAEEAEARHRLGVRRLLEHAVPDPTGRVLDGLGQRREARPGRLAVPVRGRAAGRLPYGGPPGPGRRPAGRPRRGRLRGARRRGLGRARGRRARHGHRRHRRPGALAGRRQGARWPRRHGPAAGADGHEVAARPAGRRRVRGRGRREPAAPLPDVPARAGAASRASRRGWRPPPSATASSRTRSPTCRRPTCTGSTRSPRADRPTSGCVRSGGCWRSSGSRSGPSSCAPTVR